MSITLLVGFSVEANAQFLAIPEGCDGTVTLKEKDIDDQKD